MSTLHKKFDVQFYRSFEDEGHPDEDLMVGEMEAYQIRFLIQTLQLRLIGWGDDHACFESNVEWNNELHRFESALGDWTYILSFDGGGGDVTPELLSALGADSVDVEDNAPGSTTWEDRLLSKLLDE